MPGQHGVLPLADHRCRRERLLGDRGERLVHGGRDLGEAPAVDDAQDDLLAGCLLEELGDVARRERGRDRVGAGLQGVLALGLVEDERERERGADDALLLETLRDLTGRLAARDHEGPAVGARVLCQVDLRADAVRDEGCGRCPGAAACRARRRTRRRPPPPRASPRTTRRPRSAATNRRNANGPSDERCRRGGTARDGPRVAGIRRAAATGSPRAGRSRRRRRGPRRRDAPPRPW